MRTRAFALLAVLLAATPSLAGADTKTEGVIPGVLFGPKLNLVSIPNPGAGLEVKFLKYFGASFDYNFLPSITVQDVTFQSHVWSLAAKVYPFGGAFHAGLAVGAYRFEGSTVEAGVTGKAIVSSTFIAPQVGWRWVWGSGLFLATDLGWAFPLRYDAAIEAAGAPSEVLNEIEANADRYLKVGVPLMGLLQLGWLF